MGDLTYFNSEALKYDKIISVDESLEYLSNRGNFMTFSKGLVRAIEDLGWRWDESEMAAKLWEKMESHGVKPSSVSVVRDWIYKNAIISREFAIKLCFALEMTIDQATEFLNKVCFQNGFNPRCADEIVYFYCLKFNKSFSHAEKLLERYNEAPAPTETADVILATRVIVDYREELVDDDEAFIASLTEMKNSFMGRSQTAREWYFRLKDDIVDAIRDEDEMFSRGGINGYGDRSEKLKKILFSLYTGVAVRLSGGKNDFTNRNRSSIAYVLENMPYPTQLKEVEDEEKQVPVKRDTLLILYFFSNFYADYTEQDDRYEEFYESMNSIFEECGMRPLYPPNPLDWLILKCVHSLNVKEKDPAYNKIGLDPVAYFNEILEKSFGDYE